MNCPNCQAAVQPGQRYCIGCGTGLPVPQATLEGPVLLEPVAGQSTTIMVVPATKTKGTALAIEAVASIFGIFGIGWLYSGNTAMGIVLLIAGFAWDVLAFIAVFISLGFGAFCIIPLHFVLVLISVLLLNVAVPKA